MEVGNFPIRVWNTRYVNNIVKSRRKIRQNCCIFHYWAINSAQGKLSCSLKKFVCRIYGFSPRYNLSQRKYCLRSKPFLIPNIIHFLLPRLRWKKRYISFWFLVIFLFADTYLRRIMYICKLFKLSSNILKWIWMYVFNIRMYVFITTKSRCNNLHATLYY